MERVESDDAPAVAGPASRLDAMERVVILEGARTPIGRFLGSFAELPTVELGVLAAREAMRRAAVEPTDVQQTIDRKSVV
jgi:acetyl-CoA acetyltransferase